MTADGKPPQQPGSHHHCRTTPLPPCIPEAPTGRWGGPAVDPMLGQGKRGSEGSCWAGATEPESKRHSQQRAPQCVNLFSNAQSPMDREVTVTCGCYTTTGRGTMPAHPATSRCSWGSRMHLPLPYGTTWQAVTRTHRRDRACNLGPCVYKSRKLGADSRPSKGRPAAGQNCPQV